MFTTDDMLSLDYFDVLSCKDGDWELQSKNTGHCWKFDHDNDGYFLYLIRTDADFLLYLNVASTFITILFMHIINKALVM